jgi:hypothetical protein
LFTYGTVASSWVARQFGNKLTTVSPVVVPTSDRAKVMEWKARTSRTDEEMWVGKESKKEELEREWVEAQWRWAAWCESHGRYPSSTSKDKVEAELGVWMNRQRSNPRLRAAAKTAVRDAKGRIVGWKPC